MTHEEQIEPIAPMAPGVWTEDDLGPTQPYPAFSRNLQQRPVSGTSDSEAITAPEHPAVTAQRAERAAEAASRSAAIAEDAAQQAQTVAQPAQPRRWPSSTVVERTYIREHPGRVAAGVVLGVLLCAGVGAAVYWITHQKEHYAATTTQGAFACKPAIDLGGFPNGTIVDTSGKQGAIVDDTPPGQQTQVAVIPPNTTVKLNQPVHEWLYTDCTLQQITNQAKQHANATNANFVSDWHQLSSQGSTGALDALRIPTLDIRAHDQVSSRIAARRETRLQAAKPLWRRVLSA